MALVLVALGGAGIGIQATWLSKRESYQPYAEVVKSITGLVAGGAGLDLAIIGAGIVIAGGIIALLGSIKKGHNPSRYIFMLGLFVAMVGGIIELVGGVQATNWGKAIGPETYTANENVASQTLSGDQSKLALFGLAIYTKCCAVNNWISLGPYGACGTPCPGPQSGAIIDVRVNTYADVFDLSLLCTCIQPEKNATFNQYVDALTQTQCNKLKTVLVDYNNGVDAIPTTCERGQCLPLSVIKQQFYPTAIILKSPLVGYQLDSANSSGELPEGQGFGCGIGYQKGIMWFQALYNNQNILPSTSGAVALGVLALVLPMVFTLLSIFFSQEDRDLGDESKWEKTLAANWNDPETTKKVDTSAPDTSAQPVAAYQVASNDFADQLIKFYAKHDPKKTRGEVDNIAAWAKQNGLAAINKKLKDKYGADLSTADADTGGPPI